MPSPPRIYFGARLLTPGEHAQLQQLADRETAGNLSALVRRIVLGELGRQPELGNDLSYDRLHDQPGPPKSIVPLLKSGEVAESG